MMKTIRSIIIIMTLFVGALAHGQSPTAKTIQDSLRVQFGKIEDYSVKVKVSVKLTGLRMPRKRIKLYYKAPDMVKIEANGFAIVPKIGLGGSPAKFLKMLETIEVTGIEDLDGQPHWVLMGAVIADSLQLPFVEGIQLPDLSMTLWVDTSRWVLSRVVTEMESQKVFTMNSFYGKVEGIYLPHRTVIELGLKGLDKWSMKGPLGGPLAHKKSFGNIAEEAGVEMDKNEFSGTIIMEFSKYKVNQGLKDEIFKE